jgi:hypothetical protein
MHDPEIVLEWWRDASGYELLEPTPDDHEASKNALLALSRGEIMPDVTLPERLFQPVDQRGKPERVRRKGGTLVPYRPTDVLDFIFREFVNTPTDGRGVISFVNRFGLLYYSSPEQRHDEPVSKIVANIRFMNAVIDELGSGERADEVLFGADGTNLADLKARLTFDEISGSPKVTLVPLSLMAALWLHFAKVLSSETIVLRRCLQCDALFDAGVGSGRRKDSKFCADAHRVMFNNQRLSERRVIALDQARSRKRGRGKTA